MPLLRGESRDLLGDGAELVERLPQLRHLRGEILSLLVHLGPPKPPIG
jgi:hypothetical protein